MLGFFSRGWSLGLTEKEMIEENAECDASMNQISRVQFFYPQVEKFRETKHKVGWSLNSKCANVNVDRNPNPGWRQLRPTPDCDLQI